MLWAICGTAAPELLCYGTLNGYVVIWTLQVIYPLTLRCKLVKCGQQGMAYNELLSERRGARGEVLSIAHNKNLEFIVGSRDGLIQLLKLDLRGTFQQMWTQQLTDPTIPKTLVYSEDACDIYVFGLYDGAM